MFLTGRVVEVPGAEGAVARRSRRRRSERLDEAKKKKEPPPAAEVQRPARSWWRWPSSPASATSSPGRSSTASGTGSSASGLVMPLDQMHSENPPSHPELLAWLARDTVEHGYDLRRLIRGLVLSRAYARDSRWESAEAARATPVRRRRGPAADARCNWRRSMWVATTDPASLPDEPDRRRTFEPQARGPRRTRPRAGRGLRPARRGLPDRRRRGAAAEQQRPPRTSCWPTAATASSAAWRRSRTGDERVDLAVRNDPVAPGRRRGVDAPGRVPRSAATTGPSRRCRQLVWALLTSAEFRFNH